VLYCMVDLKRRGMGIRDMVSLLENAVIELLESAAITAIARKDAPGVYIDDAKIASIGLRVSRGCTYHGLSVNIDMDLEPFSRINPCGLMDISVTQLSDLAPKNIEIAAVANQLVAIICGKLGGEVLNQGNERSDIF